MSITDFLKHQKQHAGRTLSLAVGLGTVAGFLLILQAWCLAQVVNGVIFRAQTVTDVMPWLWGMLAILFARGGVSYLSEQVAFRAASDIKQKLRELLFQRLRSLGPGWLQGQASGDIATRLSDGVEALEAYYARYLPAMSLAALVPLSILGFLLPLDWRSALVMLLTAPLIPFFMILIGKGAERLNQRQWQTLTRMGGRFLDVIQGLTTLKLFNASRREAEALARISEEYRQATMKVLRVAFLSSLALEFFSTISIAIVAVLIGFRLLFGEQDFLSGFFVLLLAPEFYLPLRLLGTHYHARMEAIGAAEGILEIIQAPVVTHGTSGSLALPAEPLRVELRGVHVTYPGERVALAGTLFEIRAGERIAIVGPSGSGKSTLINLLLGFIQPQQGEVRINGLSLNQLDLADWRQRLAWVPQRPRVFHGTVADNISLGLQDVSEARMFEALEKAQAMEFIQRLPQGLHTHIGEAGRSLSGGQIQRLALARAFLRNAALVLMDEPTANLDSRNEGLIGLAIDALAKQATLVTVAHRLHTVQQADRILVLDRGRLVQQGRHDELMAQRGLYRQLVEASGDIL